MAFPVDLASVLSGASVSQLHRWRRQGLFVPEVSQQRPVLYSFRDVAALRAVTRLRAETSLQRIRKAFANMEVLDLTEHPSEYQFWTDGRTIVASTETGFVDLVQHPGQYELVTLEDIFEPFESRSGRSVVDFRRPRPHLRVDAGRQGGLPVIEGTRITYDTIASAVDGTTIRVDDVAKFWPGVTPAAAADAVSFDREVRQVRRGREAA